MKAKAKQSLSKYIKNLIDLLEPHRKTDWATGIHQQGVRIEGVGLFEENELTIAIKNYFDSMNRLEELI